MNKTRTLLHTDNTGASTFNKGYVIERLPAYSDVFSLKLLDEKNNLLNFNSLHELFETIIRKINDTEYKYDQFVKEWSEEKNHKDAEIKDNQHIGDPLDVDSSKDTRSIYDGLVDDWLEVGGRSLENRYDLFARARDMLLEDLETDERSRVRKAVPKCISQKACPRPLNETEVAILSNLASHGPKGTLQKQITDELNLPNKIETYCRIATLRDRSLINVLKIHRVNVYTITKRGVKQLEDINKPQQKVIEEVKDEDVPQAETTRPSEQAAEPEVSKWRKSGVSMIVSIVVECFLDYKLQSPKSSEDHTQSAPKKRPYPLMERLEEEQAWVNASNAISEISEGNPHSVSILKEMESHYPDSLSLFKRYEIIGTDIPELFRVCDGDFNKMYRFLKGLGSYSNEDVLSRIKELSTNENGTFNVGAFAILAVLAVFDRSLLKVVEDNKLSASAIVETYLKDDDRRIHPNHVSLHMLRGLRNEDFAQLQRT